MLLVVGLDVAMAGTRLEGEDVHVHVEAEICGRKQEVLAAGIGHALIIDPVHIIDVGKDGVCLVALDRRIDALVEEAEGILVADVLEGELGACRAEDVAAIGHGRLLLAVAELHAAIEDVEEDLDALSAESSLAAAACMHRHDVVAEGSAELRGGKDRGVAVLESGDDVLDDAVRLDEGPLALVHLGTVLEDVCTVTSGIVDVAHESLLRVELLFDLIDSLCEGTRALLIHAGQSCSCNLA